MSVKQLKDELEAGTAQLFDVREPDEWAAGHLTQAISVPLSGLKENQLPDGLDKAKKTYLHCRSGRRVLTAKPLLDGMGFDDVVTLDEGYDALVELGFEKA